MSVRNLCLLSLNNSNAMSALPLRIGVYACRPLEPVLRRETSVTNLWCKNVECHNGLAPSVNKMQTTHSKGACGSVPQNEGSVSHNEGANDNDSDEWDDSDEVFANQRQRHEYEGFCWRQERYAKQPMSYAAWSQVKTHLGAELELKRLLVAEHAKQ